MAPAELPGPTAPKILLEGRAMAWAAPQGPSKAASPALFEGVSVQVEAGLSHVLTGPSGCGKSTLLRCLVHIEPLLAGDVWWQGKAVTRHNVRAFRSSIP